MVRKTKQKEAIINILRGTTSHPSADWVYEQVRKEIPNISLGTVYRNLRLLKESGQILELISTSEMSRFDGNTELHYHFRCDGCGKIFDIEDPVDTAIEKKVARKTGFEVAHHNLELGGLCLDCQKHKT
jgi:Fur family transcriptional regulator, peroxide stress response regulator